MAITLRALVLLIICVALTVDGTKAGKVVLGGSSVDTAKISKDGSSFIEMGTESTIVMANSNEDNEDIFENNLLGLDYLPHKRGQSIYNFLGFR